MSVSKNFWKRWGYAERQALAEALEIELALTGSVTTDITGTLEPEEFRNKVLVDSDGQPKIFGSILDPWQDEDFKALDTGWMSLAGWPADFRPTRRRFYRAYLERPRGHSKTTDTAVYLSWALSQAPRKIVGYWAASDRDQARLGRDAIDTICRLNPWIGASITINKNEITNIRTGSHLEIIANDVEGSYGYLPDFVVCDELTHWKRKGMWDSLFSSAAKRALCMLVIISNAGMQKYIDWQWTVREMARESKSWYFNTIDGPQASWITPERLQEQREGLTPSVFNRLWMNIWSTGDGDKIPEADILAACTKDGPMGYFAHERMLKDPKLGEISVIGGLDLGVQHDHSALVALATQYGTARIRLADCKSWRPKQFSGQQVDLTVVEDGVIETHERLRFTKIFYDPHQCELMAQRLRRRGIVMEPMPFVGQNLNNMAEKLVEVFRGRVIDLYDTTEDARTLLMDIRRLTIVEKAFGLKLESARTEDGHADTAIALAIALPEAVKMAHRRAFKTSPPSGGRTYIDRRRFGTHYGGKV